MTAKPEPVTLGALVGARLRETREAEMLTQEDVARLARDQGLTWWRRATVAQLETGRRQAVSVAELLALCWVFDVDVVHWLDAPPGTVVGLTPEMSVPTGPLADALGGGGKEWRSYSVGWDTPAARASKATLRALREELDSHEAKVAAAAAGDAECKAARSLGTSPERITELSFWRWGRSFTAERDARVAETAPEGTDQRTVTALRGHLSRALRAEIAPYLTDMPDPSARGRAKR